MLTLINNTSIKDMFNYTAAAAYNNAFIRTITSLANVNRDDKQKIMSAVFYGVKYLNSIMDKPKTKDAIEIKLSYVKLIETLMKDLTPVEFMSIFPVKKEYDGEKSGWKDYFYTMHEINKLNPDEAIGDNLQNLLWDYQNNDVSLFLMAMIGTADDLLHLNGQKSATEQFLEDNGIPTYTEYEDTNGKKYIQDNQTGRTAKVRHKMPRYIQVVH